MGVLSQTGKSAEALKLVEQLTPSQQERWAPWAACALPRPWAKPEPPPNAATTMPRAPHWKTRCSTTRQPLVRLDLARLYLKMGATSEARGVMDGLLVSNPHMPEALYASALLASETRDWTGALATLERIPEKPHARHCRAAKRVWAHVQADAAAALGQRGSRAAGPVRAGPGRTLRGTGTLS